jgi:putative hydrolase of the HAD superfamily
MIRAVIFDYFDTLLITGAKGFYESQGINYNNPQIVEIDNLLNSRQISLDEYYQRLAEETGLKAADIISNNQKTVNRPLMNYIKKNLFRKYKLAILSNVSSQASITKHLSAEELAMFDYLGMSWQTGFLKPDERAYLDVTERLAVKANQSVFVDDRLQYCQVAAKLGMKVVLYDNFADFVRQMEQILEFQNA